MNITYLVSKYPAISHTFIHREISELRRLGWKIKTLSVNEPDPAPIGSLPAYSSEAQNTHVIKRNFLRQALCTFAWALINHPVRLFNTLKFVQRHFLTPKSPIYLIEALIVARQMMLAGQTHLHVHFGNAAASVGLVFFQSLASH